MENILHNPDPSPSKAGFIAKNNIVYKVNNPKFIDLRTVHLGYISINEYNQEHGIKSQVVNFGPAGGYLFPIK